VSALLAPPVRLVSLPGSRLFHPNLQPACLRGQASSCAGCLCSTSGPGKGQYNGQPTVNMFLTVCRRGASKLMLDMMSLNARCLLLRHAICYCGKEPVVELRIVCPTRSTNHHQRGLCSLADRHRSCTYAVIKHMSNLHPASARSVIKRARTRAMKGGTNQQQSIHNAKVQCFTRPQAQRRRAHAVTTEPRCQVPPDPATGWGQQLRHT
jgi:hypothetical protein